MQIEGSDATLGNLTPGQGQSRGAYRMPMNWRYYAKKRFSLYPGIRHAVSARFLQPYYARRRSEQSVLRVLANAALYLAFQLWLPFRARQIARRYGLDANWARDAVIIARKRFADPNDIALFRITSADELDTFIRRFEHSEISKRINPINWRPECVLGNKIEFYARCVQFGLPHPRVLATMVDGHLRIHAIPQAGVIAIKPTGGEGGDGFRLLDYHPAGRDERASFETALLKVLDNQRSWVVQEKVAPHEALHGLAMAALPTARITTMINEQGSPEVVTAVLRFPVNPAAHVDNIKAGGLMAPIDIPTGQLGVGCRGRGLGEFVTHPVTSAPIDELLLPYWEEAKALALRAHGEVFSEYNLVGWDVALTDAGPLLIEGNGKPCMIVAQRAPRRGIGETRFGHLVAYHLERASRSSRNAV